MENITLASGHEIPMLGLGTWRLKGRECKRIIKKAIEIGYTHIDTAWMYENQLERHCEIFALNVKNSLLQPKFGTPI